MNPLPPLEIVTVLRALNEHEVDFVLIGGLAVIVHGVRRNTLDLDIVIERGPENARRMAAAYAQLGVTGAVEEHFRELDPTDDVDLARAGHIQVTTPVGRVDIVRHEDWGRLVASIVEVEVAGVTVRVAGRDELIAMKLAAGRPKDLQDVADMTAHEARDA